MDKYNKTTWVNGQTPLNATNLNKIEGALEEISQEAIDGSAAVEKVDSALDSMHFSVAESSLNFTKDGEEKKISIPIGEMIREGIGGKLDKVTTNNGAPAVYAKDGEGGQYMIPFSANVAEWHIPYRVENGNLKVPLTPSADEMATSKHYVDAHAIKEINTEYVRIWDLDAGIYKLTYSGTKYLYHSGLTNTTYRTTIGSGIVLLIVFQPNMAQKTWEAYYNNKVILWGYTDVSTGFSFGAYRNSPITKVNETDYLTANNGTIYAPITKGENGQVLVSNGSNTPVFKNVFVSLTQDEYDALSTKDENVLYLIKE